MEKTKTISLRLTIDDYNRLQQKISDCGTSLSTFIRNSLLEDSTDDFFIKKNLAKRLVSINHTICDYPIDTKIKNAIQMDVDAIWQYLK